MELREFRHGPSLNNHQLESLNTRVFESRDAVFMRANPFGLFNSCRPFEMNILKLLRSWSNRCFASIIPLPFEVYHLIAGYEIHHFNPSGFQWSCGRGSSTLSSEVPDVSHIPVRPWKLTLWLPVIVWHRIAQVSPSFGSMSTPDVHWFLRACVGVSAYP